ncbi:hypothetical protein KY284_029997 [Solanum tuberosum]|nr:hypothetical protein KY284_029997 [Solanum tuberosum]
MEVVIPGATTFNVDDNAGIGVSSRPKSVHELIKENDGTSCQPNDVVQIPSQEKKNKRWGDFFLPPQLHGWKEVESW